jgi:hypothetical protein
VKHLLALCPRLPPYNGADAQRVRVMLPHLAKHGWRATVLAASDDSEAGARDPELVETIPPEVTVMRVRAWPRRLAGVVGLRQHMVRAWWPWRAAVGALTADRRFDAMFVSHTDFALWPLTGVGRTPVVLDWQDPWWSDYYARHPDVPPPGGRLRYGAMQWYARCHEPRVARAAAAHVVVSPGYVDLLRGRYPTIPKDRFSVLPFAAAGSDRLVALSRRGRGFPAGAKQRWWVYAGRGGKDLHFALSAFFDALHAGRLASPQRYADLGILFVGTAYDGRDRSTGIATLARERGVGDMVVEQPERIGQMETYRLFEAAEALIVPGSDDPAYVPSKLAPYLLTGKPILGLFHAASPAHQVAGVHAATRFLSFRETGAAALARLREQIGALWFGRPLPARAVDVDLGALEAAEMTARLCAIFDRVAGAIPS